MEAANEMRSHIGNIEYYVQELKKLTKKQLERDCDIGNAVGIAPDPGSVRFDSLGIIYSSLTWIDVYTECMKNMIKRAEGQDGKLRVVGEENAEG